MRAGVFLIILTLFCGCLKEDPLMLPFNGFAPVSLNDGVRIATPESQYVDKTKLGKAYDLFYDRRKFPMSKGLAVVRNGYLISEAYSKSLNDVVEIDNIQSCTKSIVALLMGIAIEEGLVKSVDDPVYDYLPEYFVAKDPRSRKITIKNCLTMQAGLPYNGNEDTEKMVNNGGSSLSYILSKPVISEPGTTFLYSDYPYQLLTGILQKVTSGNLKTYAKEKLFHPLEIDDVVWETAKDGVPIGSFSLFLTTRDLAKIGVLCIQNGAWNGAQLVPSSWIQQVSKKQALDADYGYGYYIGNNSDAFQMKGNGGQFVYIHPSKQLVIAYTASPYTDIELWGSPNDLIEAVVSACENEK